MKVTSFNGTFLHTWFADCFKLNENQNAGGATRESSGDSSKSECEAVCLSKSLSECAAYEFNRENTECWIHATQPSSLNPTNGIDHYKRIGERCLPGGSLKMISDSCSQPSGIHKNITCASLSSSTLRYRKLCLKPKPAHLQTKYVTTRDCSNTQNHVSHKVLLST